MLKTITATGLVLPRPLWILLNFADTYSLTSTNINHFQTNTKNTATANPSETYINNILQII